MAGFPSGVYALTPECADTARLLQMVEAALKGGAAAVQYREKTGDVALRHEQASELLPLCHQYHAPLIVNDDLRLADLTGADGVHLGREDASLREARLILGPAHRVTRAWSTPARRRQRAPITWPSAAFIRRPPSRRRCARPCSCCTMPVCSRCRWWLSAA